VSSTAFAARGGRRFGSELAGRVGEVGAAVTEFRVGDEVFGIEGGARDRTEADGADA
jgi:NADPH:quinone reductase-like Zn-dependent oxidoreductase